MIKEIVNPIFSTSNVSLKEPGNLIPHTEIATYLRITNILLTFKKGIVMKYIMKLKLPTGEEGNKLLKDPDFGKKMQKLLSNVKAEAAYFTTICGHRGGYIVINMDDASQIPAISEPFFLWLKAEIDFYPVMTPEDLGKAGPAIGNAVKEWG